MVAAAFVKNGTKIIDAMSALNARVMLADANLNILYMNHSVTELLQSAEADLKKEDFSVDSLIGRNIDAFHKNPSHQRKMLASLSKPHKATIWIGERAFDLNVTPLKSRGKITSFVVEWADAKERLLNQDYRERIEAIGRTQAVIEFSPDGVIQTANGNFLKTMGYRLEEIIGRHHSIFMNPAEASTPAYRDFWSQLAGGHAQTREFIRLAKGGKTITLNASYNPIRDTRGEVARIVKYATDVSGRVSAVLQIGAGLEKLANSDLSFQLNEQFDINFENLRKNMNKAVSQLGDVMRAVVAAAEQIEQGTHEISTGANDLSHRTEQQAASLEETAAALDEITVNVANSTKRVNDARKSAADATNSAKRSSLVVGQTVAAMSRIQDTSNQIASIISVIDEIAFQTNLLALNAGVEAARAGEAGKGFAVVAQEVRELAQRSAKAAKEIKDLINNSATAVSDGAQLVQETGESLDKISAEIVSMNEHMEAIASSSNEQSVGLSEVNIAVNQMDQVTQQNAAMVEETTAASAALAAEASGLRGIVEKFQLQAVNREHHRRAS